MINFDIGYGKLIQIGESKLIRLNLGCGPTHYDDEIGVDLFPTAAVNVQADLKYLPFPDNCAEFIRLDHVLEHIPVRYVTQVLMESYRCLCNGGSIRIGVPDLLSTCASYVHASSMKEKIELLRNLYGSQAHNGEFHQSGWDKETLFDLLDSVGFSNILVEYDTERNEGICLQAFGVKCLE